MAHIGNLFENRGENVLQWKIKNFFSLSKEIDIFYESPKFYFAGTSFVLRIYPSGMTECDIQDSIGLFLIKKSSGPPISLNYSFAFKTIDGQENFKKHFTYDFKKREFGYENGLIILKSVLLDKKFEVATDVLTVICTIKNSQQAIVAGSLYSRLQDVSDNLKEIFEKSKRTDLILKVDGEKVPAHRMILETRLSNFDSEVNENGTKQNQTGELHIRGVDKNAMISVLHYLYSGDIQELNTQNALSIYAAAIKYDINELKELCNGFIIRNLSVKWVCEVIKFSKQNQQEELESLAIKYFDENTIKVLDSEEWNTFARENKEIGIELLATRVKDLLGK